jgi:hypothetical protein
MAQLLQVAQVAVVALTAAVLSLMVALVRQAKATQAVMEFYTILAAVTHASILVAVVAELVALVQLP